MAEALSDIELLSRLVAFDSTSSHSNLPIADFICDYVSDAAPQIERNFNEDRTKVNLVMRIVPCSDAPPSAGLTFSGHLDTVPATEPEWTSNPFTLTDRGDRLVGRGACDMKGFVALAVNAFRSAASKKLKSPLLLILTFDEEPGILGAQHLARTWKQPFPIPKATIVGEPTQMHVVRMHKGHLKMRLTFRGKSAHTGYAHLGMNAIEPACHAVGTLADLNRGFQRERSPASSFYPDSPSPSLTVTQIHGGTAGNVVPDRCVVDFGIRLLPDMNPQDWEQRVRAAFPASGQTSGYTLETTGISAPFCTSEKSPIYESLTRLVGQKDTHAVSYASDAGPLQSMGLDCVLFGPGNIEVAHKPDEWMPIGEFQSAKRNLEQLIREFCE